MLGGVNSYLASSESYFGLDNTTIKNITSSGITDTTTSTTSGLRPAIYLQNDVKVTGSGTSSDPYRLSDKGDVIFASATLNGTALETFPKESDPYIPKTVTCTNGSVGHWNTEKQKIELTTVNLPTSCVVDFTEGYTVTLSATNGTVTAPTSKVIGRTGTATFTVTPNDGYKAELETDNCGGTLSGSTYTISSITAGKTCSIIFKSDNPFLSGTLAYKIYEKSKTHEDGVYNENGYRYEGVDPNNYIQMEKSDRTTEMWRIIGLFPDGENGENIIRVRKAGYEKAAYDSNSTNHWPNTTLYTTLSSTYSLTNYKNTVNYKMYLGTSNKYNSYVLADYYDMERMLNSKGMAGATSKASYSSETKFTGSVGLMYPSDYGYAVLASDCARTIKPLNYHETTTCYDNNWLYHRTSDFQLLITPIALAANLVSDVSTKGYVTLYGDFVTDSGLVAPVMALSATIVVTGSGTQSDPYVMQ